MTSVALLARRPVPLDEAAAAVMASFDEVFGPRSGAAAAADRAAEA
jgi:hypothetical protein